MPLRTGVWGRREGGSISPSQCPSAVKNRSVGEEGGSISPSQCPSGVKNRSVGRREGPYPPLNVLVPLRTGVWGRREGGSISPSQCPSGVKNRSVGEEGGRVHIPLSMS